MVLSFSLLDIIIIIIIIISDVAADRELQHFRLQKRKVDTVRTTTPDKPTSPSAADFEHCSLSACQIDVSSSCHHRSPTNSCTLESRFQCPRFCCTKFVDVLLSFICDVHGEVAELLKSRLSDSQKHALVTCVMPWTKPRLDDMTGRFLLPISVFGICC